MPRYHSRTRLPRRSSFGLVVLAVFIVLIGAAVAALFNRDRIREFAQERSSDADPVATGVAEAGRSSVEAAHRDPPSADPGAGGKEAGWRPPEGFEPSEIVFRVADARVDRVAVRRAPEEGGEPDAAEFFGVRAHVPEGERRTEDRFLIIELDASNRSGSRRLEIGDLMDSRGARLEDDAGNRYRRVAFGTGEESRLAGSGGVARPGEVVRLGLIFEPPLSDAGELTLTIPAERLGGSGQIAVTFEPPER